MIKIYGMPTCPDCAYVHEQIIGREDEFQYIDIGEHVRFMNINVNQKVSRPLI